MLLSLINLEDNPYQDGKYYIFAVGGQPSSNVKTVNATDTSAFKLGEELRVDSVPIYYVNDLTDTIVKRKANYKSSIAYKNKEKEIKLQAAIKEQIEINALESLKSDMTFIKIPNEDLDAKINAKKTKRDR